MTYDNAEHVRATLVEGAGLVLNFDEYRNLSGPDSSGNIYEYITAPVLHHFRRRAYKGYASRETLIYMAGYCRARFGYDCGFIY